MHTAIIHAADAHAHLLDEIITAAIAEVRARGLEVKAESRQPARGRSELFIGAPGPVIPLPIAGPLGVDSPLPNKPAPPPLPPRGRWPHARTRPTRAYRGVS